MMIIIFCRKKIVSIIGHLLRGYKKLVNIKISELRDPARE